ncbi:MAG: hypothetical protein C4326_12570 [Ignavibacteria bacterium]
MAEIEANKRLSDIHVETLTQRGYTQTEISAAFNWLYDNLLIEDSGVVLQARPSRSSRRQLHPAEKMLLTTEAQGFMMLLFELGLLDTGDFETVMERAMISGYEKITLDDIREIAASVIIAKPRRDQGGQSLFNSNETIH